MKNIQNRIDMTFFVICLVLTVFFSVLMCRSSGAAMDAFGGLTLVIGAVCTWSASRMIRPECTAK